MTAAADNVREKLLRRRLALQVETGTLKQIRAALRLLGVRGYGGLGRDDLEEFVEELDLPTLRRLDAVAEQLRRRDEMLRVVAAEEERIRRATANAAHYRDAAERRLEHARHLAALDPDADAETEREHEIGRLTA